MGKYGSHILQVAPIDLILTYTAHICVLMGPAPLPFLPIPCCFAPLAPCPAPLPVHPCCPLHHVMYGFNAALASCSSLSSALVTLALNPSRCPCCSPPKCGAMLARHVKFELPAHSLRPCAIRCRLPR